jgi:hypothetical protein
MPRCQTAARWRVRPSKASATHWASLRSCCNRRRTSPWSTRACIGKRARTHARVSHCGANARAHRSAFPAKKNFPFLKQLGLKASAARSACRTHPSASLDRAPREQTVVYLCPEEYPEANLRFLESIGATLRQYGVGGNKELAADMPDDVITAAVQQILGAVAAARAAR